MPMLSHSNSLMDEDAGIMSEAETSATGFRRGSKQRASLPVVRTPSKTLERPLGLVFLQFRHETKRALLPNEITTLDTVRALFVRSFARQLSMEYFDSNNVHIYIHDPNQDMFYELEDLRDIRDRSILRLFETDELQQPFNFQSALPISLSQMSFLDDADHVDLDQPLDRCNPRLMISSPLSSATWDELSYFSEPEFDSDYRPQHVHKSKDSKTNNYRDPQWSTINFVVGSYSLRFNVVPQSGTNHAEKWPVPAKVCVASVLFYRSGTDIVTAENRSQRHVACGGLCGQREQRSTWKMERTRGRSCARLLSLPAAGVTTTSATAPTRTIVPQLRHFAE